MLYEKKMLILSGEGKGVVLIEKSAKGLRFSLSTFDMPTCGKLKAGIITPSSVIVRDLPERDNPSLVFFVDETNADNIHFAVFDTKLRLYGTNGKRMWEANVMGLLSKNDRKPIEMPPLKSLPPLSTPPQTLPLPNGTGIPQSRLGIYGDEQIAESNFYTHLDLSERMATVDNFLDTPRAVTPSILDGLAPRVLAETTAILESDEVQEADSVETAEDADNAVKNSGEDDMTENNSEDTDNAINSSVEDGVKESNWEDADNVVQNGVEDGIEANNTEPEPAAAATTDSELYSGTRPCDMAARWLKTRSTREAKNGTPTLKQVSSSSQVKPLREISFIERASGDIDKLFGSAEKDDKLTALLPDIVWIKVPVDEHVISVGRGGNDFLCYAVPGTYHKISPLGEDAQWLPENKSIPTGKGYWLIFQSLKDGSIIKN